MNCRRVVREPNSVIAVFGWGTRGVTDAPLPHGPTAGHPKRVSRDAPVPGIGITARLILALFALEEENNV